MCLYIGSISVGMVSLHFCQGSRAKDFFFFSLLEISSDIKEIDENPTWQCDSCNLVVANTPVVRLQHRQECSKNTSKGELYFSM